MLAGVAAIACPETGLGVATLGLPSPERSFRTAVHVFQSRTLTVGRPQLHDVPDRDPDLIEPAICLFE